MYENQNEHCAINVFQSVMCNRPVRNEIHVSLRWINIVAWGNNPKPQVLIQTGGGGVRGVGGSGSKPPWKITSYMGFYRE